MKATLEGRFAGHGDTMLLRRSWRPPETPHAVVVFVHGLGEHTGIYGGLGGDLVGRGYALEAYDVRGHGLSPGPRVYIDSWEQVRADLHALVTIVRQEQPRRSLFIVGHSAGGLTVLDYALHHPEGLAGVVACSPAIGEVGVPGWLLALARGLSRVWPTFAMNAQLDFENMSRDREKNRAIVEDPLYCRKGTVRLGSETLDTIAWTRAHAAELRLPLLVLHGTGDRITSPEASRSFFDAAGSPDKTYRSYPGAFHNLFHDPSAPEVIGDLRDWLDARTAGSGVR
jgi:alpha-beta hydrolase superfamily lysophospholipase